MPPLAPLPRGRVSVELGSADLLGHLAEQLGRPRSATLDPGPIEQAEIALGTAIPYDVLAVLAIEQRSLRAIFETTIEAREFYDATQRGLARDLGFDKVVLFAILPGDPAEPRYAGFDKTARPRPRVGHRMGTAQARHRPHTVVAGQLPRSSRQIVPASAPPFALAFDAPPEVVQYATHPKFGRGRVLARADSKVTVEFSDGKRTLAERFVVFEP
jgi:hypothetical protein